MERVISLLSLFTKENTFENISESLYSLSLKIKSKFIEIPNEEVLSKILGHFSSSDVISLHVSLDNSDNKSLWGRDLPSIKDFILELHAFKKLEADDSGYILKLDIRKSSSSHFLTIYNSDLWLKSISELKLSSLLHEFSGLFLNGFYGFCSDDKSLFLSSKFLRISSSVEVIPNDRKILFSRISEASNDVCHFADASQVKLIPYDFYLIERSNNEQLNGIFDKLTYVLLWISISNFSEIREEDSASIKFHGYKTINAVLNFGQISVNYISDLYKVFDWIYIGGQVSDKIELARNILSLHLENEGALILKNGFLTSLWSGYRIYLKGNIELYLETRSKLVEFVSDSSQKASEIVNSLTSALATNSYVFITFFVTVIITNIIGQGKLSNIFNPDITVISRLLLLISALHGIVTIINLYLEKSRWLQARERVREQYTDVLAEDDLDRLFLDSETQDITYIRNRMRLYGIFWALCLVCSAFAITALSSHYKVIP